MVVPDRDQARDLTAELWAAINPSKLNAAPFHSVNSPFWFAVTARLPSLAQHNALTGNRTLFRDWCAIVAQINCRGKSAVPFGRGHGAQGLPYGQYDFSGLSRSFS